MADTSTDSDEIEAEEQIPAHDGDICRVCRLGSTEDRPLFHPCLCTGSIRFVHQECLIQWLTHSGKEYCELCHYKFQFAAIYRPDMPKWLPVNDLYQSLVRDSLKRVRRWLHTGFVMFMWLFIVPVCSCRIYKFLFYESLWSIARLPIYLVSSDNLIMDSILGLIIVTLSLLAFISLVWLKDQLTTAGPQWLAQDQQQAQQQRRQEEQQRVENNLRLQADLGRRAREKHNAPERQSLNRQISVAQQQYQGTLISLETIALRTINPAMMDLRIKEMTLSYDLQRPLTRYRNLLSRARTKHGEAIERWRRKIIEQTLISLKKDPKIGGMPREAVYAIQDTPLPTPQEFGLNPEEAAIMELYDRLPKQPNIFEKVKMERELAQVRKEQKELTTQFNTRMQKVLGAVTYSGEGDFPEEGLTSDEVLLVRRARRLSASLEEAHKREEELIREQTEEDRQQRRLEDNIANRLYNRVANRNQDIPRVMQPQRQQRNRNQPARPNLRQALAGLAREPQDPNAEAAQADQLTKLVGLDGSFRFLEHVVWLIVLITTLIILFAYAPYSLGMITADLFSLWSLLGIQSWKGVLATFLGYLMTLSGVVLFYYGAGMTKLPKIKSMLGITYLALKIGLLLTVEAGIFPLLCGWWMDICSFTLSGSNLSDRQKSFSNAPGTVMFLHWLSGMVFIFYFASFVVLLREIFRPGVLWFLRNLNDNNFHPIQDMIAQPFERHLRRFAMSNIMFGFSILVVLLIPSRIISWLLPSFLPFNITLVSTVSPIREVQLELILLQFVIPTLLEHSNSRLSIKTFLRKWSNFAANTFGLQSYILDKPQSGGDVVDMHGKVIQSIPYDPDFTGPAYTGPTQTIGAGFAPFKPYLRPPYFFLRMFCLLIFTTITIVIISVLLQLLPVLAGRSVMSLFGITAPPDFYTAALGLYLLWLFSKMASAIAFHISMGTTGFLQQIYIWFIQGIKSVIAGLLVFILIPLLLGHIVDLLIISPIRVPADKTPIFYYSTEWALGLLHAKCICGVIWLTNMPFKRTLEQVYMGGFRNLNLTVVVREIAWPIILGLSLCITVPYVLSLGLLYETGLTSYHTALQLYRYCYPGFLIFLVTLTFLAFFFKQLMRLYVHVRNERYLVGRQLMNYGGVQITPLSANWSTPVEETGDQ